MHNFYIQRKKFTISKSQNCRFARHGKRKCSLMVLIIDRKAIKISHAKTVRIGILPSE